MYFAREIEYYLRGEKFHKGLAINFLKTKNDTKLISRKDLLRILFKNIIHLSITYREKDMDNRSVQFMYRIRYKPRSDRVHSEKIKV